MVSGASVFLFLLTISGTRCWSESLSNVQSADEVRQEVGNIDAGKSFEVAQEIENEEETDNLGNETPDEELNLLSSHASEGNGQNDAGSAINGKRSSAKKLSDLGISESDLQQLVAEAEDEVKRDVPKIPNESSHAFSRMTYQAKHYRAQNDPEFEKRTQRALVTERVMEKLAKKLGLSNDEAVATLTGLEIKNAVNDDIEQRSCVRVRCDKTKPYRELDGMCNNLVYPCRGAVNTPFKRLLDPDYADKLSKPRESKDKKHPLPNPRLFSFNVFKGTSKPSESLTHMTMIWGQFIDHDLTLSGHKNETCPTKHQSCTTGQNRGECFGVPVPSNDPHFVKDGVKCLHLVRSARAGPTKCECEGISRLGVRQQSNTLTAFIDASHVYGVDKKTLKSLLIPSSSLLRLQRPDLQRPGLLPPLKPASNDFCRSPCKKSCFNAGDGRVNENQGLASMHTLFVREHNRIARELTRRKPYWSPTKVFEETRKIIGAQIQHITYNEFLPIILNRKIRSQYFLKLEKSGFYTGYSSQNDPSIINSFATAAYRFGHSLVRNTFSRPGKSAVPTKDFFNPCPVYSGTNSIFRGLSKDRAQEVDRFFSDAITKFLILDKNIVIDLPAINIQRGRDHGLPGYNEFRKICGLRKARRFYGFVKEISYYNIAKLQRFYRHPDDVDLYAGGIMEKPLPGGVLGPTFSCLVAKQFQSLRNGDRFWYENQDSSTGFNLRQLTELRKVSLARVICDNEPLFRGGKIRRRVMELRSTLTPCDSLPKMNFRLW